MSSMHCPDCSTEVTSADLTCPSCNFPVAKLMGLSSAILRKDAEMVAGLIQLGADVNAIDKNGRTPLMIAASIGNAEIVQMLLAAGAKLDYENQAGETALSVARSKDVEKLLRRAFVVSRFISLRKPKSDTPEEPLVAELDQHQVEPVAEPAIQPHEEPVIEPVPQQLEEPEYLEPSQDEPVTAAPVEASPAPLSDLDATQPIPINNEDVQQLIFGKSEAAEEIYPDYEIPEVEELPAEPVPHAAQEDVIEETLLISPFLIHEAVEEPKTEIIPEVINEEVQQLEVEAQQPEQAFEFQKPIELEVSAEPLPLDFDQPLGTTELSAWENRAPTYQPPPLVNQERQVEMHQLEEEAQQPEKDLEIQKPVEFEESPEPLSLDFDQPLGTTELSAWENRAPVYQPPPLENQEPQQASFIEESHVETQAETPALDFDQPLVRTDVAAWENRVEYEPAEPMYEAETFEEPLSAEPESPVEVPVPQYANEEEFIDDIPPMREPFIGFSSDELEEEQIAALSNSSHVEMEELPDEFIESVNEQPMSFQFAEDDNVEVPETPRYADSSEQFQRDLGSENSSLNHNTAHELRSKFQDYEEWFELHQSSQEDFLRQGISGESNEAEQIAQSVQQEPRERIPDVNCLECGEVIGPNELRCSKCHTTIVRRYCAGCSELIPDHAIFCPYCGSYVTEHFHFAKKARERSVLGATIGLCILILLMVLTWPRTSKPKGYQATENLKPANQIVNSQRQKSSPIVFVPPETSQQKKVESPNKTKAQPPVQRPPETKVAANTKRPPKNTRQLPVDTKQPTSVKAEAKNRTADAAPVKPKVKPVTAKATVYRELASTQSDEEKIKLGRSLNSRGYSLINQGRPGEAIPLLEKSLRSFPKGTKDEHYAYALFNLGVAWRMAGRPDIAIPILEKRIKINNQRDVVARELNTARKQAQDAGFGSFHK